MEYFEKKITYLRGLCDGSDFPAESKEGKIFHGILDVLDDMAFMLETFMDDEDLVMEDEDLDETDEPIFFYSFNCPSCGQELDVDEQTMEMQTEIPCPGCGMTRAHLAAVMALDKKAEGDGVRCVLLTKIGACTGTVIRGAQLEALL